MELVKSLSFVKNVKEQKSGLAEDDVDEYTPRTKEELLADFKAALEEVKLIQDGKKKGKSLEEFLNELQD